MRLLILLLAVLMCIPAWTQNDEDVIATESLPPVTHDKDSVRRYYIKQFPDYFFIYPVLKQRSLNFELGKRGANSLLTYKPNNTYSLGLGVYLFELGVELAFAIPLREQSIERFGESHARDIHLNVLNKRWG